MSPCSPNDVAFPVPSGPSGPPIPGFGTPFSLKVPNINPFPAGFPEDLLTIFNTYQFLIPPGVLKPSMHPNFAKDVFDAILSMLDQFMPFLMLYKFFLPILNLIICIIEVLCALMNPFALVSAINRLFNQCIPEFLNLFPIFALIIMIISLLSLLLALIEYLIAQILKFVNAILRNVNSLVRAFQTANATSILAVANKLGSLLCIFQNLFVLLSLFNVIIEVIKDILSKIFAIPPCEGGGPDSTTGCCAATYCPTIVQNPYTRNTGTFQYLNEVQIGIPITGITFPGLNSNVDVRTESWQLYDDSQTIGQAFYNIVDGYDISPTINPKPVFFPTDAKYTATTSPQQSAYTVNLRLLYNPSVWGRPGATRYIRFNNCIVLAAPTQDLETYNNTPAQHSNGVFFIAGGAGYEDNGTTKLTGFASDGYTPISAQATLNNFIHQAPEIFVPPSNPVLLPTDGYTFSDMTYTFTPNLPVLLQKNLVTLGCEPSIALARSFVNNVAFGNIAVMTADLNNLVFPDPAGTQACLSAATSALQFNMTPQGVAQFQATSIACLAQLQAQTTAALTSAIGIGFSPCNSSFTLNPNIQFTTEAITVAVNLTENNGISLATGLPASVGAAIAANIKGYPTFGTIGNFTYDGYQSFTAPLTSITAGSGQIMVSYENQILCTNTFPTDGTAPTHTLQNLSYEFVYSPPGVTGTTSETGAPRRDAGDISREGKDGP